MCWIATLPLLEALAQLLASCMGMDPLSGQVFVSIGRHHDKAGSMCGIDGF